MFASKILLVFYILLLSLVVGYFGYKYNVKMQQERDVISDKRFNDFSKAVKRMEIYEKGALKICKERTLKEGLIAKKHTTNHNSKHSSECSFFVYSNRTYEYEEYLIKIYDFEVEEILEKNDLQKLKKLE